MQNWGINKKRVAWALVVFVLMLALGAWFLFFRDSQSKESENTEPLSKEEQRELDIEKQSKEVVEKFGEDILEENEESNYNKYSINKEALKQKYPKYYQLAINFTRWKANAINPSYLTTKDQKYKIEFNKDYTVDWVYRTKEVKPSREELLRAKKEFESSWTYRNYTDYKTAQELNSKPDPDEYSKGVIEAYNLKENDSQRFSRNLNMFKDELNYKARKIQTKTERIPIEMESKDIYEIISELENE